MKYFVFADPHGHFTALKDALNKAGYDETNDQHKLIGLGDYFDRGEENDKMAEFIIDQYKKEKGIFILGNHDEMLLNLLTGLDDGIMNCFYNGFDTTVNQLSQSTWALLKYNQDFIVNEIKKNYPDLLPMLRDLPDQVEIGDYIFTHAGYSNKLNPQLFPDQWELNRWGRTDKFVEYFHRSDLFDKTKIYVFGHWHAFDLRQKFLKEGKAFEPDPFIYENFIGLDSCSIMSKKVNVLVLDI